LVFHHHYLYGIGGKIGTKKAYPEAASKEEEFNELVEKYHQNIALEEPKVVKDISMLSKLLQTIAYIALAITLILVGNMLFGSSDESNYIDNREVFYTYNFICTLVYFLAAYWVLQRGKKVI
jgi:hypothetical protein